MQEAKAKALDLSYLNLDEAQGKEMTRKCSFFAKRLGSVLGRSQGC